MVVRGMNIAPRVDVDWQDERHGSVYEIINSKKMVVRMLLLHEKKVLVLSIVNDTST